MEIKRAGSQASTKGSTDYFTGAVRVDPLFQAPAPARLSGAAVTFEPSARTAWHTHPLGQTLVVTAGFWSRAAMGRTNRGDSARRRGVVPTRRKALARGLTHHGP